MDEQKNITEERVTKKVIRRRASSAPTTEAPEPIVQQEANAPAASEEVLIVAEQEQTVHEVVEPLIEEPSQELETFEAEEEISVAETVSDAPTKKRTKISTPSVLKKTTVVEPEWTPPVVLEKAKTKEELQAAAQAKTPAPVVETPQEIKPVREGRNISQGSKLKVVQHEVKVDTQLRIKSLPNKEEIAAMAQAREQAAVHNPYSGLSRKEIIEIKNLPKNQKGMKRKKGLTKLTLKKTEITQPKAQKRIIRIDEAITVGELSKRMSVKVGEVIKKLMELGVMTTLNHNLDHETAGVVASEFGFEIENVGLNPDALILEQETNDPAKDEEQVIRPPVVTVMGHVDHGKTTLLDAIRKTNVVAGESGGITQHIGAYTVMTEAGKLVTFIDTPGHESFTAMRARGAKVTDIVILVVAGDDGVMPQTKEAVNHAKNAGVPMIVAVNKMDKPDANPERVKKELTEFEMVPEEWGGDTVYIPVAAKARTGIAELLEAVLLQAEVMELKASPNRLAKAVVIESRLDKGRGPVMTILIQDGTLKIGDVIVIGPQFGKVRAMRDDQGKDVKTAGPSIAVEIMGMPNVALAGDNVVAVDDEKKAKQISEFRRNKEREIELAKSSRLSLDSLYQKIEQGELKELKVIVKADTAGSVEVLTDTLHKLSTPKVTVKVIHGAVGGISENDVMLAKAGSALIVGFHVRPQSGVKDMAENQNVEISLYEIIYELTGDLLKAMAGLLAPKRVETDIGQVLVRDTFSVPKIGTVAGCHVATGKITRNSSVRILRDSVVIHTGKLASLKRFKDDAKEVTHGFECGLSIDGFNDIKVGDTIEAFLIEEIAATL